jgi:hypothetical protein
MTKATNVERARKENCEDRLKMLCGAVSSEVAGVVHIVASEKCLIGARPKSSQLSRSVEYSELIGPWSQP